MGIYSKMLFPWVLDATEPPEMLEHRRMILAEVRGEILEIGIGTGINLPLYPEGVMSLSVIEPEEAMQQKARQKAEKAGIDIDWFHGKGEQLPFEDEQFDTIVVVDVLCSVDDVDAVLKEAYRVLKAGGRLHFLEHGLAEEKKIRKWQFRLNGISKTIACGCQLTRDMESHLRTSDFAIDHLEKVAPFSGMNSIYTHIKGIASK